MSSPSLESPSARGHALLPAGSAKAGISAQSGPRPPAVTGSAASTRTSAIEVITETSVGLTLAVPVGVVLPSDAWAPTARQLVVANLLPLLPGKRTPVAFRLRPLGGATWWIDDFYVDPKRRA